MTTLMEHSVAEPTEHRFIPKKCIQKNTVLDLTCGELRMILVFESKFSL